MCTSKCGTFRCNASLPLGPQGRLLLPLNTKLFLSNGINRRAPSADLPLCGACWISPWVRGRDIDRHKNSKRILRNLAITYGRGPNKQLPYRHGNSEIQTTGSPGPRWRRGRWPSAKKQYRSTQGLRIISRTSLQELRLSDSFRLDCMDYCNHISMPLVGNPYLVTRDGPIKHILNIFFVKG